MENTTHWKNHFNYSYLGAYSLLPKEERTLTIKETKEEEVIGSDGKKQMCFVAHFEENEKPMILNKTNCKIIEKIYGTPYTENWKGFKITVYATTTKAWGDTVEALRIRLFDTDKQHKEISELYKQKMTIIPEEQMKGVLRVMTNKEIKNYNKTITYLKSL